MNSLLCAIIKNENRYLREFVDYYKGLGVSKIVIYDNNDIDGEQPKDIINDYILTDYVTVYDYRGKHISLNEIDSRGSQYHGIQEDAYNDCYKKYSNDYDWIMYFDVDEYLVMDRFNNINDFLSQDIFNEVDAIQLNWQIYGDNNNILYEDKPLNKRFTKKSKYQKDLVKTIVKTKNERFVSLRCHYAVINNGVYVYPNGENTIGGYNQPIKTEGAYLKHFFTKTIDEWIDRKYKQTSATGKDYLNNITKRLNEFFMYNEMTSEKLILIGNKIDIEVENRPVIPVIVSLTSYGKRLNNIPIIIRNIYNQSVLPKKIVLTIYKDDINNITPPIKKLIERDLIELIVSDENLRPHLKYFYTMQKYRKYPVITIDDDYIYHKDTLLKLYESYLLNPTCITGLRCHLISYNNENIDKYGKWQKVINVYNEHSPNKIFVTGTAGVLYPPDVFKLTDKNINEIRQFITADDIYLNLLENKFKIPIILLKNKYPQGVFALRNEDSIKDMLYIINVSQRKNDEYIDLINRIYLNYYKYKKNDINQLISDVIDNNKLKRVHKLLVHPSLEIHLADNCNLNCAYCSHFSPVSSEKYLDPDTFEQNLNIINIDVKQFYTQIHLMGGEPLLNPNIVKIIKITRNNFPKAEIKIVTNGILLNRMSDDFWDICKECSIIISITKYPIKLDYENIEALIRDRGVHIEIYGDRVVSNFEYRKHNISGGEDYIKNYFNCKFASMDCNQLVGTKLYKCPTSAYLYNLNKVGASIVCDDYVELTKISNFNEVITYLTSPLNFCQYCKPNDTEVVKWKKSNKDINEWI